MLEWIRDFLKLREFYLDSEPWLYSLAKDNLACILRKLWVIPRQEVENFF